MPAAFIYLLKLSVSLAVVFLFYQLVLRRLTFYNWNRWYLLGYTLLSFVIPLIDISPALNQHKLANAGMVQWIPLLYTKATTGNLLTAWNILSLLIITGMLVMLIRLIGQLFSFHRMRKKATLISDDTIPVYQVNESIIPFSFGNAVFINRHLHTEAELEEIIRHEFVHVKQRHSIDIVFSELLCLLNWYNPFAWLLRAAIRQNLEFVADNRVLENGLNKKQYQYLLLKVIGNDQFSIAQKFNFSSLKKRITMMNKNKSTKMHLLRFLFLLPVLAFILISFRKEIGDTLSGKGKQLRSSPIATVTDTIPDITIAPPPPPVPPVVSRSVISPIAPPPPALVPSVAPIPPVIPISPASVKLTANMPENIIYLLDGIEINKADLDKLDPEKIESINVLKGSSAVALYGEKGRDGVIIIKTKNSEKTEPINQTPFLFPLPKKENC